MRALLVQPKRLALFTYLALARPARLHRRDALLSLFWPESGEAQARSALRQALHFLRRTLGAGVLASRGDEEIGVSFAAVWCDAREFDRALHAGRLDEALALYRGELLEGFHATGVAAEFDRWLDDERSRLRSSATAAARRLADEAERAGNAALAAQRLRELLRLEPMDESAICRLMTVLDRVDDRAAALRAYDEFARRLANEIEAEPSVATADLAARLRRGGDRRAPTVAATNPPPAVAADALPTVRARPDDARATPAVPTASPRHRRRRWIAIAGTLLVLAAVTTAPWRRLGEGSAGASAGAGGRVVAIGIVEDRSGADTLAAARVVRGLLATDLARIPGIVVVSQSRLQELLARTAGGVESRATLAAAARSAGATEVLEGELFRRERGVLRLDVRRVDAGTGVIRHVYSVEGSDLFALVGQVTAHLAAELGQRAPAPALADLTTTSIVARRFYEEGVRAYYLSDMHTALRLFRAALAEDSSFAMAAHYAARAAASADAPAARALAVQAVRTSRRATDRERLLIATYWAELTNDPSLLALARELARRFPVEPEADLVLGRALAHDGEFVAAIPHFRRALERDSFGLAHAAPRDGVGQPPCTACAALTSLVWAYNAIDSLAAAERTARAWIERQPESPAAWQNLAVTLGASGRAPEALEAWRARSALARDGPPDDAFDRAMLAIRIADFAEADRLLGERARDGGATVRQRALWLRVVSLRNQGRLVEALRVARQLRALAGEDDRLPKLAEAQVRFEMGHGLAAAALFDSARVLPMPALPAGAPDSAHGIMARHIAWYLSHAAAGHAAAGDTVRLARLVDSVRLAGARSAYGRDRRLHHHLHGLRLLARGDRAAAEAAFRRAIYSPTLGYTRTNLELGRLLLASGRPREAIRVVSPALRGDLQASNYYVTHAELHELLARAHAAAGQVDSARAHRAWVARAWRRADPAFVARARRVGAEGS